MTHMTGNRLPTGRLRADGRESKRDEIRSYGTHFAWTIAIGLACGGCGGAAGLDLATTSGSVTFSGRPIADCRVTFTPVGSATSGGARSATGLTSADGTFALMTDGRRGAVVGEHAVFVGSEDANSPLPGEAPANLRFVVKKGANQFTIELMPR